MLLHESARLLSGASKKASRYVVFDMMREKGVLPVPTTITGPCTTSVPLKYVRRPRSRRGASCSMAMGQVVKPSVLTSRRSVKVVLGDIWKTPL